MIKVNIHDAKTHFSSYLAQLKSGEVMVICKRNLPYAEVRLVAPHRSKPRPLGLAKTSFDIPSSFFEPLPDDVIDNFNPDES